MLATTLTGAIRGIEGYLVRVEVDLASGIPSFHTVGLPDAAVREAKERVRAAVRNCGFRFPEGRITINLAPADVRKEGSAFDLAVAMGILAANREVPSLRLVHTLLLGELALDGALRPVPGVLAIVAEARRRGIEAAIVPLANGREAALVGNLGVYPVGALRDVVDLVSGENLPAPWKAPAQQAGAPSELADLAEVKGQYRAKRALEVAAGGGHNLLLCGPPGAGKTLLARRLPSILPELSFEEALEVTQVHSAAGILPPASGLLRHPPFRAPHHTMSWAALAGGGTGPRPGEISLAHHGVLFLDELAEFNRNALESLRQPLEEGSILLSRARRSVRLPARFTLVAAMNPCPCGYLGETLRPCSCTPAMVARYRSKISGPLLDRIDLHVAVRPLSARELLKPLAAETSETVRARVVQAREVQRRRFWRGAARVNAQMRPAEVGRHCGLDQEGRGILWQAAERMGFSARAFDRILKVARTIADLEGREGIEVGHLQEAIQYRALDGEGGLAR